VSNDNLVFKTIHELQTLMAAGDLSSRELTQACIDHTEAVDGTLGAYLTRTFESALREADAADTARAEGSDAPLLGIPMALKDVICTKGVRTTCGSKILDNFVPPYDATIVTKLRDAGAVFLGKVNLDEFAMGSSCENSAFHPTRNPWDPTRVAGGSSGGSACAVAAGECIASIGSDTGGSIRQPAAFCGIVGVKPTYGRVSRYGLVAYGSSLDQMGPFSRDVHDAAILLNAICGHDPMDSTSAPNAVPDFTAALGGGVEGIRIGLPKEYFIEGTDAEIEASVREAARQLESLGAELVEVSLPHTEYGIAAYYICATAEASSNLARYDGMHYGHRTETGGSMVDTMIHSRDEGFGLEVKRRIMLGTYALSAGYYDAFYGKALKVRTLIRGDFDAAYGNFDVLLSPTSPSTAFDMGSKTADPLSMYLNDLCTIPSNLAGHPAMSVPFGRGGDGLPVGVQVLAPALGEVPMFRTAAVLEAAAREEARS